MKWLPFALLALIVAVLAQLPPGADVAWQLWIGRSLLDGARLYRDIIEINPPLWFWIAVPIVSLAALLHVSGTVVLVGFLGVCAAVSLLLSPPRWRLPMVLAFFLAGISATGQREQFTLITVAPFVLLCAARAEDREVSIWKALIVGVWAALGIALKPYFVLVPLALGLWLFIRERRLWPELAVICVVTAAYLLAVVVFMPDYLGAARLASRFYGSYDVGPLTLFLSDAVLVSLFAFVGLALVKRDDETTALVIAGIAFLVAYLIQHKGFRYQGLPAIGLLCMAALANLHPRLKAVPLVLALVITFATTFRQPSLGDSDAMAATADLRRGSSILIMSPIVTGAWPMVHDRGYRWSSAFMFYWMHADPYLTADVARADIGRHADRLLVDDRLGIPVDVSAYRLRGRFGHFAAFDRR